MIVRGQIRNSRWKKKTFTKEMCVRFEDAGERTGFFFSYIFSRMLFLFSTIKFAINTVGPIYNGFSFERRVTLAVLKCLTF